eukprot:SAG31_NODE_26492_length_441_cov_0.941520_2_plen_44_part_01
MCPVASSRLVHDVEQTLILKDCIGVVQRLPLELATCEPRDVIHH